MTPLRERWRSKAHVGDAAPSHRVTVQRGLIDKTYAPPPNPKRWVISGGNNAEPWQGFWRATGEPIEVPGVEDISWDAKLDEKGARSCTIGIENILYPLRAGAGGDFHEILRGFLSPTRGVPIPGREQPGEPGPDEWTEVLDNGYRIDVWEGYGDQMTKTFAGLIDTTGLEVYPDRITITARSFWSLFTDQRIMGWNKPPEIRAPLTIADKTNPLGEPPPKHLKPGSTKDWLLVPDPADAIAAIFTWAGFTEYHVEIMGLPLLFPLSFGMDKFFQDVIDEIVKYANFVCYERKPSTLAESIGVPHFEHSAMTYPARAVFLELTDNDMLEHVNPKFDLSILPYIIRWRGNVASHGGSTYDEELVKRFEGVYFPPWSGAGRNSQQGLPEGYAEGPRHQPGRVGGVRRHAFVVDSHMLSDHECLVAALLAAQQYALEAYTVELQIAGLPELELNSQVSVVSEITGINSRVLISGIHSEHKTKGKDASYKMTVTGALLDTLDMAYIREDLAAVGAS